MIRVFPGIRGLIVDCDGTLADTMSVHIRAWVETLKNYEIDCPVVFLETLRGMPAEEIVMVLNEKYNRKLDPQEVAEEKDRLIYEELQYIKPIEPVAAIARDYKGEMPMSVASGGTRANVLRTLNAIGLGGFFHAVITADDRLKPKPNPDMFLESARIMGVKPELCQVFEDGDLGLEAAAKAGMKAVDVRPYL
jgi:beta-phosphoglucomutase-like phosphatase (HAD superfamily)